MNLLALETTTLSGSIALLRAEGNLFARELPAGLRSARSLAPAIAELLAEAQLEPRAIEAVAVVHGPGSFTGLRVGLTTARMFAFAVGAKLLGIDTHDLLAEQIEAENISPGTQLEIVLDAQRDEFFAVRFERGESRWNRCGDARLISQEAFLAQTPRETLVNGPALAKLETEDLARLTLADWGARNPRAETAARLAARRFAAGESDDLFALAPKYMRVSYAEEKAFRPGEPK